MSSNPVEQFVIKPILGNYNIVDGLPFYALTNSAVAMLTAVLLVIILFTIAMFGLRIKAISRLQAFVEVLHKFIDDLIRNNVGEGGVKYFPFVFSVFLFVFIGNMLGMIPYSFTFTSHLVVTFALSSLIFIFVTIIGFYLHGFGYLRMFFPKGAPIITAIVLVPIELISYFSRPFSLAVRLFANMTVGHIMLKVLAGFVVSMGIAGFIPFMAVFAITILELFIGALQAYVFTILTCIYLNDAINLH